MAKQSRPGYRIKLGCWRILYFPVLLPVAMLLALFNKISPVPFKIYALRVERIGQMAGNQEQLMAEFDLGMHPKEFRVFIHRDYPSNQTLLDMQKRVLPIHNWLLPLFDVCHKLGGLGVSSTSLLKLTGRDELQVLDRTKPHLSFSDEEIAEAEKQCRELGIDPALPIVSVLGRDTAYLDHLGEPTFSDCYRNIDINTFVPAMEYLAEKAQVVRLGSVVHTALDTQHPSIWDYSLSGKRTELLDVYFSAVCRFYLTCGTGPDSIAAYCFRLPVLYVDYLPLNCIPELTKGALVIPKRYWHVKEERYLNLSEMLEGDLPGFHTKSAFDPHHIEVHDNTPEEILEATKEMDARIDGIWVETAEDLELQKAFWRCYENRWPGIKYACRIGADFLRNNPEWTR